jgi:uridine kinase
MPILIAICGGSGSGKTFLSRALSLALPQSTAILSYDNYYKDQSHLPLMQRDLLNYDDPSVLDSELFLKHLSLLRRGQAIDVPQYDFASHTRKQLTRKFEPADIILVEGIMVLQFPKDVYDFTVYVEADPDVRLSRRVKRDILERGRTVDSVINQYLTSVKPMHVRYVEPCKNKADFVFVNNESNGIDEEQMHTLLSRLSRI